MRKTEEILNQRLERLQSGEPLESCLEDLPAVEAGALKMVAFLTRIEKPEISTAKAAAQKRAVRKAVGERSREAGAAAPPRGARERRRWFVPAVALSGMAGFFLICFVTAGLVAGIVLYRQYAGLPPLALISLSGTREPGTEDGPVVQNPDEAVLTSATGLAEIQGADGTWHIAHAAEVLRADQAIRTGQLSSAVLTFHDGSRAELGPNTEISLDVLDARTSDGPRVIQMTQRTGESTHVVAAAAGEASKYEVVTPSGAGVAHGTRFRVLVTSTLRVRFEVGEGSVAVTSLSVTVLVVAGESTSIEPGEAPGWPTMLVNGEGEVRGVGTEWRIAAHPFLTSSNTLIIGDPSIGDWVRFEGRILVDGTRFADRIILLRRAPGNAFVFRGTVESIGDAVWIVSGRSVSVPGGAQVDPGVVVGDMVEVRGAIRSEGSLVAARIRLVGPPRAPRPFEFTGVIEDTGEGAWMVSGIRLMTDTETVIQPGLQTGDLVRVHGWILADGAWRAGEIERAGNESREFEFAALVEAVEPWTVAGIVLATDLRTEIDSGILPGDLVRVEGRVLEDGTWLANEIERVEEAPAPGFKFVGEVEGLDPWIVAGVALGVDPRTEIDGEIAIGDRVKVQGRILPDGTWLAEEIERLDESQGCVQTRAIIREAHADRLVLLNWARVDLDDEIDLEGEIRVASVVRIEVCAEENGILIVVRIEVIYQLEVLPPPSPAEHHDGDDDDD